MTSNAVSHPSAADHDEELIPRYSFGERVNHWIGALSYTFALITGLAFWSPYLYWLAAMVGGGATARFVHPWFGLIFSVSLCWTFVEWHRDMEVNDDDRAWAKAMPYYIQNEDDKLPPVGRFNFGQKLILLGNFWERDSAAADRSGAVVHGSAAVELAVRALRGDSGSLKRGADYHRIVPDSRVHERDTGRGQLRVDDSWIRDARVGLDISSHLV